MSSRECERLSQIVTWASGVGVVSLEERDALLAWVQRVGGNTLPAPVVVSEPEVSPGPVVLPGTGRRGSTRAERRARKQAEEHRAQVDKLFGERPLLAFERRQLLDYEPSDGT